MGLPVIATNWCAPPRAARPPAPPTGPPVHPPPSHAPARTPNPRAQSAPGSRPRPHPHAHCTPTLAAPRRTAPRRAAPLGRSGPTAFLSEETGYPLDYELAPLPDALHQPGHRWAEPSLEPKLTRTPRGLRRVRTGYSYQPPALGTYRAHRAACPQGPTHCTYGVCVPTSGVGYVPGTVATQARRQARALRA